MLLIRFSLALCPLRNRFRFSNSMFTRIVLNAAFGRELKLKFRALVIVDLTSTFCSRYLFVMKLLV